MKPARVLTALSVSTALTLSMTVAGAAAPASAAAAASPSVVTVDALAMTGAGQQRWQSLPKSRLVLNPFDRYASGVQYSTSEVDQNSGPHLPVKAAYYSNDKANLFPNLLSTYRLVDDAEEAAAVDLGPLLTEAHGWSATNVTTATSDGATAVTVNAGSAYGRVTRSVSVDLDATPVLLVDVTALSAGAVWNAEVSGQKLLPVDSTHTGLNAIDVAALTRSTSARDVEIKLWVSGGSGKTATFGAVTLGSDASASPAQDRGVLWRDELASNAGWSTASESATLASNGAQSVVKIDGSGKTWGSVRKDVTLAVTPTTKLAIDVGTLSHKWALNAWVDGREVKLQLDSTATGWKVIDDFAAKIGTGTKTISFRLFTTGARPSAVAFDELIAYDAAVTAPWRSVRKAPAREFSTTWTPSAETFTAGYGDAGTLRGTDVFASTSAIVREIDARSLAGHAVVAGAITGAATWDAAASRLTVTTPDYVQVYAFPAEATVGFGTSPSSAVDPDPSPGSTSWTAVLSEGAVSRVAIAFAPVSSSSTYATQMTVAAGIAAATTSSTDAYGVEVSSRIAELDAYWNDYLAGVPAPDDFSLHGVPTYGVTPAAVEASYYRAYVNLEQNVIPATPETNSLRAQLGTGKASTWMSGIPGAKNVATWDTLVGLQALVYADADTAWESFRGIMDFVQGDDSAFPGEITNDPSKGGEVLPSRKAQTAWVLYNATGDRTKLEEIYPALTRVLRFGATNLHWTVKDRGIYNDTQRDSEFVTSLIVDLGYAKKISALLGRDDDVTDWTTIENHLYDRFDAWFVRTDGVFQQKVNLASDDDFAAVTTGTSANGNPSVVASSLAMERLSERAKAAVVAGLDRGWKGADRQFAGLADDLKGPNMNYIVAGLLDHPHVDDGAARAATFTNTIVRDVVRSGWFAEVYKTAGNATSDRPVVDGVRPSLFGIAAFIDSVWLNNGFRLAEGDVTLTKMSADNLGGITGLTSFGHRLDLDLTASGAQVTGGPLGSGPTVSVPLELGVTTPLPTVPVDVMRPVVVLVSPSSAGPFAAVDVRVEAADAGGLDRIVANVYQGGTLVKSTQTRVGGATSGTHTAAVSLPGGVYTVKYNAHDLAGNISATGTFAFTVDDTAPTVTVKTGDAFTAGGDGVYQRVSFKLYDAGKIDKVVINGVVKDLSDDVWSDVNYVKPGVFGAVTGSNTMTVHDVAGNTATLTFTLH